MKKTILKNLHRPIGIPAFFCPIGLMMTDMSYTVSRRVKFNPNCAYDLGNEDQKDWNKVFGVCFGARGIHKNSLRFGWRWNTQKQKIELCTIVYREDHDKPSREEIKDFELDLNQWVDLDLNFTVDIACTFYNFTVNGRTVLYGAMPTPNVVMFYGCGFYFGGNCRSPHKMSANINRK